MADTRLDQYGQSNPLNCGPFNTIANLSRRSLSATGYDTIPGNNCSLAQDVCLVTKSRKDIQCIIPWIGSISNSHLSAAFMFPNIPWFPWVSWRHWRIMLCAYLMSRYTQATPRNPAHALTWIMHSYSSLWASALITIKSAGTKRGWPINWKESFMHLSILARRIILLHLSGQHGYWMKSDSAKKLASIWTVPRHFSLQFRSPTDAFSTEWRSGVTSYYRGKKIATKMGHMLIGSVYGISHAAFEPSYAIST